MKTSSRAFLLSHSRQLGLLGLAALLAACSSTPLPPWPSAPGAPASTTPTTAAPPKARPGVVVAPPLGTPARPPAAAPSPLPTTPEGVTITPVGAAQPSAANLPFGAAVAARFPDPTVRYHTPGLAEGRSSYTSNAELAQWLRDLQTPPGAAGTHLALQEIGQAQSGTPLLGLIATRAPGADPASLQASGRPTVLLIGQQHGDEPAGSEALLAMARELAPGGLLEPLLEQINVILVPRANPDGAEASQRNTTNGVDLNRDHLLLTTPEAQALAQLVRNYRPLAVLDAHEYTVGGRFLQKFHALPRYDALLQYATTPNVPEFITKAAREWYYQPMADALHGQGLSSDWYYTTSTDLQDMRLSMGGIRPDTGRNVNGLKNTVSMLVETRGIGIGRAHLQRRVHTQVTALASALRSTAERAKSLEQVRSFVARDVSAQACRGQVVIDAAPTRSERELLMIDPQTGADRSLRLPWDSALQLQATKSRPRPCGYWLSADAGSAVQRLRLLGLQVLQVAENGSVLAETFTATTTESAAREDVRGQVEGSDAIVRVEVAPHRAAIDVPAGSYYVPLGQPWANLAVAALEPDTQSSYFANHLLPSLTDSARIMAPPALVFEED
ncbi:MAG: succinylglutamate desuccinylase/aspartoacylase family protein [Comamonadaceae bacterium]|nr:succinylglutamate desuccinylase/aspartoacylase family protein [Comamonadaceae bacterium]